MDADSFDDPCGPTPIGKLGLRIGAIFIIMVTSMFGTLFPIVSKRNHTLRRIVPGFVFEVAKFFGSGVILATGFIHLLEPAADDELSEGNTISNGGCISDKWADYPYAFGICLASLFFVFVLQLVMFRLGTEKLEKLGFKDKPHSHPGIHGHVSGTGTDGHTHGAFVDATNPTEGAADAHAHTGSDMHKAESGSLSSADNSVAYRDASEESPALAQLLGVATLEFGVIFHSIIIGLTLAVTGSDEFNVLFIVIIFHQMFEGLGLGTRLAFLQLPPKYHFVPYLGALSYSIVTPLGMAIGLGCREGLSMSSGAASVASGVLDSISGGILIYTATVELIAHEFIFNDFYRRCSWPRLWFSVVAFALGAGIMALLGKWA